MHPSLSSCSVLLFPFWISLCLREDWSKIKIILLVLSAYNLTLVMSLLSTPNNKPIPFLVLCTLNVTKTQNNFCCSWYFLSQASAYFGRVFIYIRFRYFSYRPFSTLLHSLVLCSFEKYILQFALWFHMRSMFIVGKLENTDNEKI